MGCCISKSNFRPDQPISSAELLEERKRVLSQRSGSESPESLRLLKESGAPMREVFGKVYSYGEERWRMLKMAGYTLRELVNYMHNGWWSEGDEIGDPHSHLMSPWTRLFFYCGFNINELKSVGFRGDISLEKETELNKQRARMTWHFS